MTVTTGPLLRPAEIPEPIRQALHLEPGDEVIYVVIDDRVTIVPARDAWLYTEEFIEETRQAAAEAKARPPVYQTEEEFVATMMALSTEADAELKTCPPPLRHQGF